ncbi:MAG: biotin--[acetyl-CoA-carboxylase] ligase [Methylococcaceae bacterium]|nr:biotin--[acetyl-CoA-carboxylase] ligase [Methylococcaceae bacterium]
MSDGRFHSGNFLAKELGISRTSIWKHVSGLSGLGIPIDAVSGRGYRLVRSLELLDETLIRPALTHDVIEATGAFYIHDRIDSTNRFLSSLPAGPGLKGAICLAESQTAGKGRGGRRWISPFGNNVYMSLAWQYPGGPACVSGLSLAVGVAAVRALVAMGITDLGLKWPNDILWHGKKLGGILIELWGEAQGPCTIVVGLGLNYAMSAAEGAAIEQEWVDLDTINNRSKPGRNRLVASLINEILPAVANFDQSGLMPFLSEWRALDCMHGKTVDLHLAGHEISGIVSGISDEGLIQLYTSDRELRSFASGEVSFHPRRG